MESSGWFGVRCIFAMGHEGDQVLYEERVTLWSASTAADAIKLAEADALEYAGTLDAEYLGLAQAYTMSEEPVAGAEIYSLMRTSPLSATDYLTSHFDTGTEKQTHQ